MRAQSDLQDRYHRLEAGWDIFCALNARVVLSHVYHASLCRVLYIEEVVPLGLQGGIFEGQFSLEYSIPARNFLIAVPYLTAALRTVKEVCRKFEKLWRVFVPLRWVFPDVVSFVSSIYYKLDLAQDQIRMFLLCLDLETQCDSCRTIGRAAIPGERWSEAERFQLRHCVCCSRAFRFTHLPCWTAGRSEDLGTLLLV